MFKYNEEELKYILNLQPGMMCPVSGTNESNEKEAIFYVMEEEKYINKIGKEPKIRIRSRIYASEYIYNYYLMVNVNNNMDMLYDNWINIYAPFNGAELCESIIKQEKLRFRFINKTGFVKREIVVKNTLKDTMVTYKKLSENGPWMMEDFNFLKSYVYKKYPTGQGLWHSMSSGDTVVNISMEELETIGRNSSVRAKEVHYFTFSE
jgi:hypothetical protein